jgi:aspartate aminotransferase-like enzyme
MNQKLRLLTPGPTQIPERVKNALARDMIHHRKSQFSEIYARMQPRLQALFGTRQTVLPLSCSGTGAMQAAVSNLFRPGEKVLVVEAGKFGERWRHIAASRGLEVVSLELDWGEAASPESVEDMLRLHPDARGLLVQASETSTGALHPIQDIGRLTRERDTLLVVDGISAVGVSPCPMDLWSIDCLLTGSQKGFMLPPGLALISLSPRAREKAEAIESDVYYFNLPGELTKSQQGQTLFTSPVNLIMGLDAALEIFFEAGPADIFRRQWAWTRLVRSGVRRLGLQPLVPESYTWGLTSIALPSGVNGGEVVSRIADRFNLFVAGGQDRLKGRIVRIGHMGDLDFADLLAGLYALRSVLSEMVALNEAPDYLEQAMQAFEQASAADMPQWAKTALEQGY